MIRENFESDICFKKSAEVNNIGYTYFREMFKKYTGIPPVQYLLELKLLWVKEMLLLSHKITKK